MLSWWLCNESFDFRTDMDLSGNCLLWYALPQLYFRCTVCPTPNAAMQRNRVPMFYATASSSNLPSLYICFARNVLGREPFTPCFVQRNRTPTLTHSFGTRQGGVADSRNAAGNGSRFYELNIGMGVTAGVSHAESLSPRPSSS